MPIIRMNPPSGNILTPYSVSPRFVDQIVLPKPTKYWVTFTPNFFAGTMCPTSCSAIETTTPRKKSTIPKRVDQRGHRCCCSSCWARRVCHAGHRLVGAVAGPGVRREYVGDVQRSPRRGYVVGRQYRSHDVGDAEEAEVAVPERLHRDLVGRVVDRGEDAARSAGAGSPARAAGTPRRRPARTATTGRRSSRPAAAASAHPVRPAERQADRQPHVGRRHLRDRRPVVELDHRVDHRLRVHDDLDVVVRDVEQQVRLDHLESLVDQRRGVGRDHRAHVPGRVGHRLLGCHVDQVLAAPAAERPSARRDDQASYLVGSTGAQALGQRRVLRVDRARSGRAWRPT